MNDVTGGDVDPGFGVDPKDSAALLELREAIDAHLGWSDQTAERAADYVGRIKEVGALITGGEPLPEEVTRQHLQQELDRIDHVLETHGFDSTRAVQELTGALDRLRKLESERGELLPAAARVPELVAKIVRQRFELKRFNREAKARADGLREAFKNGAVTAVRRLHDHLDRQSPHWATERSVEGVKQFLSAWIEHDDESKKNPT